MAGTSAVPVPSSLLQLAGREHKLGQSGSSPGPATQAPTRAGFGGTGLAVFVHRLPTGRAPGMVHAGLSFPCGGDRHAPNPEQDKPTPPAPESTDSPAKEAALVRAARLALTLFLKELSSW